MATTHIPIGSDLLIVWEGLADALGRATLSELMTADGTLVLYETDRETPVTDADDLDFLPFPNQYERPVRFFGTIPAEVTATLTPGSLYYATATVVVTNVQFNQTITGKLELEMLARIGN